MKKEEIFEYVQKQYGTIPEYLWNKLPDSAVLRHKNGKWYAVIMTVEKSELGLEGNDLVDIMDVKCDPEMTSMIIQAYGFLPGYHMNKQHWITILLDGSVSEAGPHLTPAQNKTGQAFPERVSGSPQAA